MQGFLAPDIVGNPRTLTHQNHAGKRGFPAEPTKPTLEIYLSGFG
jgi:hypothetical protein